MFGEYKLLIDYFLVASWRLFFVGFRLTVFNPFFLIDRFTSAAYFLENFSRSFSDLLVGVDAFNFNPTLLIASSINLWISFLVIFFMANRLGKELNIVLLMEY